MFIAIEKVIEDQRVDAFGLCVDSHSRIEVRWTALDNHHQRVGVGSLRAGEERQQACTEE